MVTGQKPFVEDDSHTVMQKIRLDRYSPPRKLNPLVPRQLEHIMARCMEKMPGNRYGSTQALIDDLVEFLATVVPINHNARLVMFLREVSVITDAEADEILEAAGSRAARNRGADRSLVKHVVLAMSALLVCVLLSGGIIQTVSGRFDEDDTARAARQGEPLTPDTAGYLEVVADPWAEVYVDGKLFAVTPTAERIVLPPGRHYLKLVNPHYEALSREVRINQGETTRVVATLSEKRDPARPGAPPP
jgi:hypothetical protein